MNPCRFSFEVAHPGLGVKEKVPASAPCFLFPISGRVPQRGVGSEGHRWQLV
jgi:hypothetical protein